MKRFANFTFGIWAALALSGISQKATAQVARTWVSGVGDDANPGGRTAPCKTFAGAISKTAANGEIDVIDPGGFGAVTITKSITIDGQGTFASINNAGTNGIIINAGASDKVVIRNLSINGTGTGINGIRFLAGAQVILQNVQILNCTSSGVDVALATSGQLIMDDVSIGNCTQNGLRVSTTSGNANVTMNRCRCNNSTNGVFASNGARLILKNCDLSINTTGFNIEAPAIFSRAQLDSCVITGATNGVVAGNGAPLVKLSDNTITLCGTALVASGGSFQTANNNRITGNVSDGAALTPFALK